MARELECGYRVAKTSVFIHQSFLSITAHIKEHPAWFPRFDPGGRLQCFSSTTMARNASGWKGICPTRISLLLWRRVSAGSPSCMRNTPMQRLVRRRADWFWLFPLCTGYDVLAPLQQWKDSYAALHMWTQIVGKVRLYSAGGQVRASNREVVRLSRRNT